MGLLAKATYTMTYHRGNKRLWLEGARLTNSGFAKGVMYTSKFDAKTKSIILKVATDGVRVVSGRKRKGQIKWTPIIDICCPEVADIIKDTLCIEAKFYKGQITIKAHP